MNDTRFERRPGGRRGAWFAAVLAWTLALCLLPAQATKRGGEDRVPGGVVLTLDSKVYRALYYERKTKTLMLFEHNGPVREYYGVPESLVAEFLDTWLKNGFFKANIEGRFPSKAVAK